MLSGGCKMTNLDNEIYRVATFSNWRQNYPSALNLARAGLAYTGSGDAVHCYKCHCVISDWKENDIPVERHRLRSPNCPLVASNSLPTERSQPRSPIAHPSEDFSRPQNPFLQPNLYESTSRNPAFTTAQMPISNPSSLRGNDLQLGAHLKLESQRFRTFDSWPVPYVNQRDLAKAGFIFTGIGDCVKCVFCNNILKQWEPGDVPFNEHRKYFPRCPFVLGVNVGNVSEDRMLHERSTLVLLPRQSVAGEGGQGGGGAGGGGQEGGGAGGGAGGEESHYPLAAAIPYESRNSLNFDVRFADLKQRLRSYENVPLPKGQERQVLALAGFYYVGPGDSVKCFQCGGVLKKWSETDQPWIEHARWFPHCVFLLKEKGYEFVNDVERKFSGSVVVQEEPNISFENSRPVESSNEDTVPKMRMEDAEQESTSLKQTFVPSSISTFVGASSGTMNNQLPVKITHPLETPSSSTSSSSLTTSVKPSKAFNEEVASVTKENERLRDAILCKICMDETANTVFLPCGHLLCCEHCAPAITDCPVCRGFIKGTLKVYIA